MPKVHLDTDIGGDMRRFVCSRHAFEVARPRNYGRDDRVGGTRETGRLRALCSEPGGAYRYSMGSRRRCLRRDPSLRSG